MKARFIEHIGTLAYLRTFWHTTPDCPIWGYHNAMVELARNSIPNDRTLGGTVNDYPITDPRWSLVCENCGAVANPEHSKIEYQVFRKRLYNTASGQPEPGDLFYMQTLCLEREYGCTARWSNCDGRHLHGVCPDGWDWDIDSRASNCTKRDESTHRCWVRHGDPRSGPVHVDKAGNTCNAGAGSIITNNKPNWHGFLDHGHWTLQRGVYVPR